MSTWRHCVNTSVENSYKNAQNMIRYLAPTDYYRNVYVRGEAVYLPEIIKRLERIHHEKLDPVLEIGPGWGTLTLWLSRAGHEIVCLDKAKKGLWMGDELLALTKALYIQGDIFCPPYIITDIGKKFQLITMTHVMAHFKGRADRAISNIAWLLRDDGVFIQAEFNREHGKGNRPYGNDWKAVPEYGSANAPTESVVVGFTPESMLELLSLSFGVVAVEQTPDGKELISICTKPKRGK